MNNGITLQFDQSDMGSHIAMLSEAELNDLFFGVIGFDAQTNVTLYNTFESKYAGLSRERVVGNPLFTMVAPCMNNFMVAHRFEEASANGTALDDTIDYVLTLRMRPVKVKLRLIASPNATTQYVLVLRSV
jgi:photoactive yellow protein